MIFSYLRLSTLSHYLFMQVAVVMSLSISLPAFAEAPTATIGRYLSVQQQAQVAQADLLQQTFQVKFPPYVKTIHDAMCYLLRFSGYALIDTKHLPPAAQAMIGLPLPQVDRSLGPVSLQEGLLTLAGGSFGLLVDPVHRLISFRLKPSLKRIYLTCA
jgi:conjugative transfer region protein (TIGR03748 family)